MQTEELRGAPLGRAMRAELESYRAANMGILHEALTALNTSASFLYLEAAGHRERGEHRKAEPCEKQAERNARLAREAAAIIGVEL